MAQVNKPNTFSANTTISSSAVNDNFDTIYDEFNGGISEANLADSAVTEDKLANSAVATAKIADDAVTAAKVDWASTGANAGIWWEELGRTTLGSAGDTITVSSLPARKYLKVKINLYDSGSIDANLRFNNDSGNNYAYRIATDGAADATTTSTAQIVPSAAGTFDHYIELDITNVASAEKGVIGLANRLNTAGAGNAPGRRETIAKWANTSDAINRIDVINGQAGSYDTGSEVIVLGHN